jgi:hypothetical protein
MSTYGPLILLCLIFAIILGVQVFFTLYIGYNRSTPQRDAKDSNEPEPTVIPHITPTEHKS